LVFGDEQPCQFPVPPPIKRSNLAEEQPLDAGELRFDSSLVNQTGVTGPEQASVLAVFRRRHHAPGILQMALARHALRAVPLCEA
jgi:hypothetical protein